jgi:hypothetical protein
MNSGFDPMIVAPSLFRKQTASQQSPFFFGGSQVPLHLGMRGRGMTSSKVKPEPKPKEPVSAETQALRDFIKMKNKKQKDMIAEMIAMREKEIKEMNKKEGGTKKGGRIASSPQPLKPATKQRIIALMDETMELLERQEDEFGESQEITRRMDEFDRMEQQLLREIRPENNPTEERGQEIIEYLNDLVDF